MPNDASSARWERRIPIRRAGGGHEGDQDLLITNRHVLGRNPELVSFRLHGAPFLEGQFSTDRHVVVHQEQPWDLWVEHPDSETDLAALPVGKARECDPQSWNGSYYRPIHQSYCPRPGEVDRMPVSLPVTMIGYPIGLWDSVNNLPIVRWGGFATHPNIPFMGRRVFLLDIACFPGSSGSPVLLHGGTYFPGSVVRFLGVLYAGPPYNQKGNFVPRPIPTTVEGSVVSKQMVHLGLVISWEEIRDFATLVCSSTAAD